MKTKTCRLAGVFLALAATLACRAETDWLTNDPPASELSRGSLCITNRPAGLDPSITNVAGTNVEFATNELPPEARTGAKVYLGSTDITNTFRDTFREEPEQSGSSAFTVLAIIGATLLAAFVAFAGGAFAGCWLTNQSWAEEAQRKEQIEEAWKKSQLREAKKL